MTNMSKKGRIALIGGGAALVVLAAVLGIWQPWRAKTPAELDPPSQDQQEPVQTPEGEKGPVITVGGKEIPCTIYQKGFGWSIYVPEGWETESMAKSESLKLYPDKTKAPSVWLNVNVVPDNAEEDPEAFDGTMASCFRTEDEAGLSMNRIFYVEGPNQLSYFSTEEVGYELWCFAPEDQWDEYGAILTAVAQTFAMGEEKPFQNWSPLPQEPEWQVAEGMTVLWLDKDGYVVDDAAKEAIGEHMLSWPKENRAKFTGQYRMDDLAWSGSYTNLADGIFVDVFQTRVRYEVAAGREDDIALSGGMEIADGWMTEGSWLNVAVFHDGGAVSGTQAVWSREASPGLLSFALDMLREMDQDQ